MYNLMKIFWPASLICHMCLLRPTSLIWRLCHSLVLFLTTLFLTYLQTLTMMMSILLHLLLHQHQLLRLLHSFLDRPALLVKPLVIFLVILKISVRHILSSREPLLYWLKFLKIMILTHLQKHQAIQRGTQQWKKNTIHYYPMTHGILYLFQKAKKLLDASRFTKQSMDQMVELINTKPY